MLFKHILSIYGSFKHMSEMLKSEPTHYMEEEEEEDGPGPFSLNCNKRTLALLKPKTIFPQLVL